MLNRRQFISQSALLSGISLLPWQLKALQAVLPMAGMMTPLRNNVGIYTERGGTIGWMISKEGIVVVDTQFPDQSKNFIAEAQKMEDRPVIDLLINTHHHGDHTGGNIAFKEILGNHVAHKNAKFNQERVAKARKQEATQLYPKTVFENSWTQKVGNEIISLRYFGPAHTNGDAVIHFENANVVHMGDLMFNRRFPYIDKSSGASISNWIKVLGEVRKTFDKDTLFIFGHAGEGYEVTGGLDDIKAMQKYLKKLLKFGKKSIKAGISQEDLLKGLETIPGAPEWKGRGLERNISAAYQELGERS
ncbi:MAG: MBL fold metallo-hydrolase [Bacteroidota bacterium]